MLNETFLERLETSQTGKYMPRYGNSLKSFLALYLGNRWMESGDLNAPRIC